MIHKNFNISRWAVEKRSLTRFLIVATIIMGIFCGVQLGQKEDPDFTFRVAIAEIIWPGASTKEIEKQIISPIEPYLQELPNIRYVSSNALPGRASFKFNIKGNTKVNDIADTWYRMRKVFTDKRYLLPRDIRGPFINDDYGDTFITLYAVTGNSYNLAQLENVAERIKSSLVLVNGVRKASIIGNVPEEISIIIPPNKMHDMGLSFQAVASLINDHSKVVDNGLLEIKELQWYLYTSTNFYSVADIKNIPFPWNNRILHISDIAHVTQDLQNPIKRQVFFQGKPAIIIGVVMNGNENILNVNLLLSKTVKKIKKDIPVGISLDTVTNQESTVRNYIQTFLYKLAFAILIILLVTFFSLGIQTGFVVALSIPIVLAATFTFMYFLGISFQKISLGALIISLGLLVDDSVISVEMITQKLEEGWEMMKAVGHSYDTTAIPMLTGTLITVAGFIPIGMARSSAGEYVFSLFAVVTISMLISWVVSIYFTPYIGYELLKNNVGSLRAKHHSTTRTQETIRKTVVWCVDNRYLLIIGTVVAFFISCFLLTQFVPQQFFPASNRPEVIVDLWNSPDSSLEETKKTAHETENYLMKTPEIKKLIRNISTYIGQGAPRFYMPIDQQKPTHELSEIIVLAKDIPSRDTLIRKIELHLAKNLQNTRFRVSLLNSGPPVGWPIQFRVSGTDHNMIGKIVNQVKDVLNSSKDVYNVFDNSEFRTIVLKFEPNQERLRALGISLQKLQSTIKYITNGLPIGELREGNKRIAILLRGYDPHKPASLNKIKSSYVQSESGKWVPLKDIGSWSFVGEQTSIFHRNGIETVTINGQTNNLNEINSISLLLDKKLDAIRKNIPIGYNITPGGSVEESKISQQSVYVNLPIFILVTMFLLMIHLKDFEKSMLVYVTAPLGLIGSTLSLLVTRQPFGFVSLLGIIALAGMIMRNSIILIDQIDQYTNNGMEVYDAIIKSTVKRFRPIVLTAAAAALAFIPLSFNLFWGPMAISLIGGLTIATILTLTFLPALYAAWFNVKGPVSSIAGEIET
ncbi:MULTISPECIES: efflux RND transporter permease subunit [Candidatus Ichthyocystis]|uniref:Putative multidrug efflux system protein n=2 Tax=Candidatus Ichthyocystis TaxID=2929841 RepID=A0A0S4M689_9BURK|nr:MULTISPECIES: efflux RND transporter permease subunit [Ichthyocystis]CUT17773.1 putative multidrug efflux system protein [Candidatus Ichthyocystis hellenicum]